MTGCSNFPFYHCDRKQNKLRIACVHIPFNHGSGAQLSAAASSAANPPETDLLEGTVSGMDASSSVSPVKRRISMDSESPSPGPKRLAQHRSVPDPARGPTANLDELTYEVLKLIEQRIHDADYF